MKTARSRTTRLFVLALAVLAGVLATGCEDVVKDATFRTWCGENLCEWTTEEGSIRRAPTWHRKDFGVELVDAPTVISQTTDKTPRCLEFTTIADVDPAAQVTIGLDFDDDGSIDHEQPIAATGWRESKTLVTTPLAFSKIRFVIAKKGVGRAVLAQMRVQASDSCTAAPVQLRDLPLGAPCAASAGGAECTSGACCEGLCAECCVPSEGQVDFHGEIVHDAPAACSGDARCTRYAPDAGASPFLPGVVPFMCDPQSGERPAGAPCLTGEDCASGACEGARSEALSFERGLEPCSGADFPDAGQPDCVFTSIRAGACR
jgi:hypothetical protein